MAAGFPTNYAVEVEFTSGAWTDVTSSVRMDPGITLSFGRDSAFGDVQPGSCVFTLDNIPDPVTGFCPFTPDSPVSPYYPNIVEGKRVRVKVTKGSVFQRFIGNITSWEPDAGDGVNGSVTVSAVDTLGSLARTATMSMGAQWIKYSAEFLSAVWDFWPFDDQGNATSLRNASQSGARASVLSGPTNMGSLAFGSVSDGLLIEGAATFTPSSDATATGPIISVRPQGTVRTFQFWFRTQSTSPKMVLAAFYDSDGAGVYSVQVQSGVLGVYTPAGVLLYAMGSNMNDGGWHSVVMISDPSTPTTTNFYIDQVPYLALVGYDLRRTTRVTVGGSSDGANNFYVLDGDIAGLASSTTNGAGGYERRFLPLKTDTGWSVFSEYASYFGVSAALTGVDSKRVAVPNTVGGNAADVFQLIARTVGGVAWVDPQTGTLKLIGSSESRLSTSIATVTLGADDVGDQTWRRGSDERPTRQSASSQFGTVTVVDTGAEAAGVPRTESSVDTTAASVADALNVANLVRARSAALRLQALTVDLVSASNSLYSSLLGSLVPGARITVASVPSAMFGRSSVDVYVQGWTEVLSSRGYTVALETTPADDVVEGRWASSRFGWGDGVCTASALTSSGTSVTLSWTSNIINLLTSNDTSFETGALTGWASGSNCTASASSTLARSGSWSMRMSSTAAGAMTAGMSSPTLYRAQAGRGYVATGYVRSGAVSRTAQLAISFYDAAGTFISSTSPNNVTTSTGSWALVVAFGAAPAGTAFFSPVTIITTTGGAAELHYWDDISAWAETAMSTNAGDYPMDLNINGERVTVTSAPAGGLSPQTVTITRGVAPSVARAHAANETVEVWDAARWAF